MPRILLIHADEQQPKELHSYLTSSGYQLSIRTRTRAHTAPTSLDTDLVIISSLLSSSEHITLLNSIRERSPVPVILLVPEQHRVDAILGLELGADDFLVDPIDKRELLARIRAHLRRQCASPQIGADKNHFRQIEHLAIDDRSQHARYNGELLSLTPTEFRLLSLLVKNVGKVVSKETLYIDVLGRPQEPFDRCIDMHVSALRKKLAGAGDSAGMITTLRGRGYRIDHR